ncbi:hypothetical protein Anapl_04658 [Anas platyrhynchos]|uniref:Uncharacterized protein n=1 Tax=Anas platyrhynchos TaxID=8839 RepID=R0LQP4_ANAPL|nr:hypothetical protein Anapl_04658 [Anas platyrhynchos]
MLGGNFGSPDQLVTRAKQRGCAEGSRTETIAANCIPTTSSDISRHRCGVLQSTGTPRAGVVWAAERCQPLAHICGAASSRRQPASTFRPVPSILCQPEVVCPSPPEPTHVLSMHSATSDSPS